MNEVDFVQSAMLDDRGIRHAWFMRYGGVSEGLFTSLNGKKGIGDPDANVMQNRQRAAQALGLKGQDIAHIVHAFKTDILVADTAGEYTFFDAAITTDPTLVLSQTTADCGSIIVASEDQKVLSIIHGSWHTLRDNIIRDTVAKMKSHSTQPFLAAIGPMICQDCYEFGPEAAQLFDAHYLKPAGQKFLVDLKQMIIDQLHESGVTQIDDLHICTKEDQRFFSHRRSGAKSGRMLVLARV